MSMIPRDLNIRPEQPVTEAPTVGAALRPDGPLQPPAPAATPDQGMPQIAPTRDQPHRRHRRRRRHRRSRIDVTSTALAESPAATEKAPAEHAAAEASFTTRTEQAGPIQLPTGNAPRKRRRRRRHRPRPEGTVLPATTSDATSGALGEVVQASAVTEPKEPRRDRVPDHRERRHRVSGEERSRAREDQREQSHELRAGEDHGARRRDLQGPRHKRGARGPKDRRHGPYRDDLRKKPEPKLYRLESIVDHGFEDAADPATEGATRVHWTILKRTTVDQHTARALSAIYVLRRDGTDTEFPHLSAARAAVNKTITHPEKLTLSKADHATARGAKK
jgi:hypothetical protein